MVATYLDTETLGFPPQRLSLESLEASVGLGHVWNEICGAMQLTFTAANCVQRRDTELRPIDGLTLERELNGGLRERWWTKRAPTGVVKGEEERGEIGNTW